MSLAQALSKIMVPLPTEHLENQQVLSHMVLYQLDPVKHVCFPFLLELEVDLRRTPWPGCSRCLQCAGQSGELSNWDPMGPCTCVHVELRASLPLQRQKGAPGTQWLQRWIEDCYGQMRKCELLVHEGLMSSGVR